MSSRQESTIPSMVETIRKAEVARHLDTETQKKAFLPMPDLSSYERADLLAALRRDMRAETLAMTTDPRWAEWHQTNARHSLHLLEVINPKGPTKTLAEPFASTGHSHPLAEAAATAHVNAVSTTPIPLDGATEVSPMAKSAANH